MAQQTTQTEEKKANATQVAPAAQTQPATVAEAPKATEKKDKVEKKTEAVAKGVSVRASKRHCMYICNFIKGKNVDQAMAELEQVIKLKRAIPYKGEVPHRKGAMMSGRYPVNAAKIFMAMLKGLKGNIIVNGLDVEKTVIVSGISNWASRPQKRAGGRAKRTNVTLVAKEVDKEAVKQTRSQKLEAKK